MFKISRNILILTFNFIVNYFYPLTLRLLMRVAGRSAAYPAVFGQQARYTPNWLTANRKTQHRQTFTFTITYTDKLGGSINIIHAFLECHRRLDYPEKTQARREHTNSICIERPRPDSNPRPLHCKVGVLTSRPPCCRVKYFICSIHKAISPPQKILKCNHCNVFSLINIIK